MAPDLNSVPSSPRSSTRSPQVSMDSLRLPASSRDAASAAPLSTLTTSGAAVDNAGVGTGPGPIRHPRPLTAADLHLQLEKEHEAVVNRLSRELSALRQQTASVASTASSVSTGLPEVADQNSNPLIFGASHPTSSRRHRSSSNISTRSINTAGLAATINTGSGIALARESAVPVISRDRGIISRNNSAASSREPVSPLLTSPLIHTEHITNALAYRPNYASQPGLTSRNHSSQQGSNQGMTRLSTYPSTVVTTRFEEAAFHRSELEAVKRENEGLRRRIRNLERDLGSYRRYRIDQNRTETAQTETIDNSGQPSGRSDADEGHTQQMSLSQA